jgi:hypothetical protein
MFGWRERKRKEKKLWKPMHELSTLAGRLAMMIVLALLNTKFIAIFVIWRAKSYACQSCNNLNVG